MDKNPNSILFLFEGETEGEFYKFFFNQFSPRSIRISKANLKGVYSLNNKVRSKITSYLLNEKLLDCNQIHVFVAFDREGARSTSSTLDLDALTKEFINIKNARVQSINEILATQDLESWFFYDLDGIYKFLKVPKSKRNYKAYPNTEATNNRVLSALFHRHNRHYQKGKRVEDFLNSINLEFIFNTVEELKEAKKSIEKLL
jgi:hypothetical protein